MKWIEINRWCKTLVGSTNFKIITKMKQIYIKYGAFFLFAALAFLLPSCSDDDEKNKNITENKVYFINSEQSKDMVHSVSFIDLGEDLVSCKIALYKSGIDKISASAKVSVMTAQELSDYNAIYSKNFDLIDPSAYTLTENEVLFSGGYNDLTGFIHMDFNMSKLRAEGNNVVLPIKISEASIDINEAKSILIIKPEVADISIKLKYGSEDLLYTYTEGEAEDTTFDITAMLDIENNEWDVDVELMVDPSYVAKYNQEKGTFYSLIQSSDYELEAIKTIEAGETITTFKLKVKGSSMGGGQFLLPIRLKDSSRFKVDDSDVYCVRFDIISGTPLDRTGWTIAGFSTEETSDPAQNVLDNNYETFWHTQWQGSVVDVPHYLVIDMQISRSLSQIGVVQRQGNNQTRAGEFWISDDNATWTQIGRYTLERKDQEQIFFTQQLAGRYLKIVITESNNSNGASTIAEIIPYGN